MKWLRPEPLRPYQISEDGKWMVNKGGGVYMLVRLGKQRKTTRGEVFWDGSEIVRVGTKEECEREADDH